MKTAIPPHDEFNHFLWNAGGIVSWAICGLIAAWLAIVIICG